MASAFERKMKRKEKMKKSKEPVPETAGTEHRAAVELTIIFVIYPAARQGTNRRPPPF